MKLPALILSAALAVVVSSNAAAQAAPVAISHPDHPIFQTGRPVMTAERLREGEEVRLDGRLDEPFWTRVVPAGDFVMQEPNVGGTPTEPTEVRIAFDRDNLYMGVTAYDSEPDRLMGNTMKRDEFLSADDRFMWTIDPFLNQQSGYFFEMNPSGLMADALMGGGLGGQNREWDGIWDARVRRSEIGWVIEIVIPFSTLNFDPDAPAWGINFQRTVRRKNEESLWAGHERNQGLFRMANAGLLVGIRDVSQGVGLDVRPYLAAKRTDAPGRVPAEGGDGTADVGLDLYYNLTPSLRANITINTDFAETEVDQRQVNLTRFPLFFPEKRGFFLEGATFFDFFNPPEARPFFSRRIGLDQNGVPQTIDGGLKLTGQVGRNDVGALYVRTGGGGDVVGEEFGVLRLRRRIFTQSHFGGIYTLRRGQGSPIGTGQTIGADFRIATSRFLGSRNLEFGGIVMATPNEGSPGDDHVYAAMVRYPNDVWDGMLRVREVQANFDPAVGFLQRRAYRGYNPMLTFNPRPAGHPLIRRFSFGGNATLVTDLDNRMLTSEVDLTLLKVEAHTGDNVSFNVIPTYERLDRSFQIHPTILLAADTEYDFTRYQVSVGTANQRVVAVQSTYAWGDFFGGSRDEATLQLGIRPRPGVTLNVAAERNQVQLPQGSFDTNLFRFIADTQFNPRIYLVNNLQYDSVSEQLGWQARLRWILRPGNDLFLVYTHNWYEGAELDGFTTLDRRAATKITFTRRM